VAEKTNPLAWKRCRGRNGYDPALDVPDDMGTEALNVSFDEGGLGTKRSGSTVRTLTGDAHTGYNALFRFVPGDDDTAAELFIVSADGTPKILRVQAGTAKVNLTLRDAIATRPMDVCAVPLNGKLHLFYDSTVNRSHVFDPNFATSVQRSGIGRPAAPTAATNGGAGLSFTRFYKIAFTEQRGGVTVRRSELSSSVSITISDDSGVTVTKSASLSEDETHWELYASDTATGTYYLIATTVVGTGTFSDTNATIPTTTAEAVAGTYTPFPSCKFGATDGSRLAGFGVYETAAGDSIAPHKGTFYFSPALDSTGTFDDERINNTLTSIGRIAVSRNSNAEDRGLAFFDNSFWCFQSRGITQFLPTANTDVPYRRVRRSTKLGLLKHQTLVEAEDEYGRPALYFLDPTKGPYRYGLAGFQWCGKDVADVWATLNLSATNVTAWGMAYPDLNAVIWWIATGSSNDPDLIIYFDTAEGRAAIIGADGAATDVRYGWAKWTGTFAAARCGVLFAASMGASMGRTLVPYVGLSSGTTLLRYDPTVTSDNSVTFQAYVQSGAFDLEPLYQNKRVLKAYVCADVSAGVTIQQTLMRNLNDETARTDTATIAAVGSETGVLKKFEDASLVDAYTFQVRLGDSAAVANAWTLQRWYGAVETQGDR
jgi:hypothetical protein